MELGGATTHFDRDIYRDVGCEVSPRCVDCPLPTCRFELGRAGRPASPVAQSEAMRRQVEAGLAQGKSLQSLALELGISRRQALRLARQAREARGGQG
jgi:hypothetical protein